MPRDLLSVLLLAACVAAGLTGGVFFAFSTFVMDALRRLPPREAVAAMQAINVAAVRVPFLALFVGGTAVAVTAGAMAALDREAPGAALAMAGAALLALGSFGVTAAANVPRNDALARVAPDGPDAAAAWAAFLAGWMPWNHVRTVACLLAAAAFAAALAARAG